MSSSGSPYSTGMPLETNSRSTQPARCALIGLNTFIASISSTVSPTASIAHPDERRRRRLGRGVDDAHHRRGQQARMIGEGFGFSTRLSVLPVDCRRYEHRGAGDGRAAPAPAPSQLSWRRGYGRSAYCSISVNPDPGQHVRQRPDGVEVVPGTLLRLCHGVPGDLGCAATVQQLRRRLEGQLIAEAAEAANHAVRRSSRRTNDGEMPPAGRYSRDAPRSQASRRRRARREWRSTNACRPRH